MPKKPGVLTYRPAEDVADLDTGFDDRTLASLVGVNVAHPDDEMASLLRGLDRWGDKRFPKVA